MEKKSWKDWEALISKNEREGALPFLPPFLRNHQFNEFVKRGWKGVGSWKGTSGIVWSNITDVGQQAEWNRELDEARLRPNCQVAVVCNSTLCSSHWRVHDSHSVDRHPTFRFLWNIRKIISHYSILLIVLLLLLVLSKIHEFNFPFFKKSIKKSIINSHILLSIILIFRNSSRVTSKEKWNTYFFFSREKGTRFFLEECDECGRKEREYGRSSWRKIDAGREIFVKGARERAGNEKRVKIEGRGKVRTLEFYRRLARRLVNRARPPISSKFASLFDLRKKKGRRKEVGTDDDPCEKSIDF